VSKLARIFFRDIIVV